MKGINNYVYGFDDSATHTADIKNIGIDFELFVREILMKKILELETNKNFSTLEKCGFHIPIKKFFANKRFI